MAATVPSSNAVYGAVDEIAANLPIRGLIDGQRPWSRREIARVVLGFEAAERERERSGGAGSVPQRIASLVDSLAVAYGDDIRDLSGQAAVPAVQVVALRAAMLDGVATNSEARAIPTTNGLGDIDAVTNPLVEPDWGRPVAHGGTASIETVHELGIGSHFAIAAQPRVSWLQPRGQGGFEQADFQRLYARATLLNVAVEGGLDEVLWGQAGDRGLLLSANPRPLHALTIGNDTAITLPWLFRLLGPSHAALMVADLGKDHQYFPGSKLVTYKLSITPTPRLELGAALMDEMGGSGSPRCSFACQVKDLFPYVFWIIHPASDALATNKVAQAELRYRIPEAAGLTLTYEGDLDDFDLRRIRSMLWNNTGHVLGARFDRLTPGGRLALDLQLHHTGLTLYEHTQYNSGLTYRRAIVGDPLGVNGNAAYGSLTWRRSTLTSIVLATAVESRDASTYTVQTTDSSGNGWTFPKLVDRPKEQRGRITLSIERAILGTGFGSSLRMGAERVRNFDFVAGSSRTQGIADLSLIRYF